jgi:hypothetical protein
VRRVRLSDVAEATAWHFGTELGGKCRRPTNTVVQARRCAYAACRELGFTWSAIAHHFERDHTTVMAALNNGHPADPNDVAAVLANAKARALADSYEKAL